MANRDAPSSAPESATRIAALEERVAFLEAVIEAIPEPVFVKDAEHRFLLLNRRCGEFVRMQVEEMLGRTDIELFDLEEAQVFRRTDREVLENGGVNERVERISDVEGRIHVSSTRKSLAHDPSGAPLIVGTIRDITDLSERDARLQSELDSALAMLERLTGMLPFGIAQIDAQGHYVYALGPDLRAMGITPEAMVGTDFRQLETFWPDVVTMMAAALAGETRSQLLEWRGRIRQVSVAPIRGPEGVLSGAALISVDVTEQRDMELRVARSERMDSLGRLAGGVAHDLNNLLSIVMMGTSVLRDAIAAGELETVQAQVRLLERSIERGSRLSRQLASFARRQVGPPTVVDLYAQLRPIQVFLESLVGAGVHLRFVLDGGTPRVRLQPGQLEQLLINLVMHSAAGMPGGGTIRVEAAVVELRDDPELRDGAYVALRVRDEAPALPAAARDRLFEPFFDPDGRGAGMGLATCYGIAVQSGGRVRALSDLARGNVSEVLLPCTDEPVGATAPDPSTVRAGGESLRILLVEDEPDLRDQLRQLLARAGHRIVAALEDGQAALDWLAARHDPVDLVLSDIVMPRKSGVDVALSVEGRLPVVLMSGYVADSLERVPDLSSRFTLLQKPVRPEELLRAITESRTRRSR